MGINTAWRINILLKELNLLPNPNKGISYMAEDISLYENEEFKTSTIHYRMKGLQSILKNNKVFTQFQLARTFSKKTFMDQKFPVLPDKDTTRLTVALDIGNLLDSQNISYAIGGDLARAMYSIPRNIQDGDINIFIHISKMKCILELLNDKHSITDQYGVKVPLQQLLDLNRGLIRFWWKNIKVELFTNSLPKFSHEAMKTKVNHEINGQNAFFLSPEALILFKILLGRNKDWVDIDRMLEVKYIGINKDYVTNWIDEIFEKGSNGIINSMTLIKAKLRWNLLISHILN